MQSCIPFGLKRRKNDGPTSSSMNDGAATNAKTGGAYDNPHFSSDDEMSLPAQPFKDYKSTTLPPAAAVGLNDAALATRLKGLGTKGNSWCARGVRESLNALFGRGPDSGPDAKDYGDYLKNWRTQGASYRSIGAFEGTQFQDYDVRVLQPSSQGHPAGHVEIFYKGHWYSDFQQRGSLWDTSKARYTSQQVYRLTPNTVAWMLHDALEWTLARAYPSATAEGQDGLLSSSKRLMAQAKDSKGTLFAIVDEDRNQGTTTVIYKVVAGKRVQIAEDQESAYIALDRIEDRKLAAALADDLVARWIKVAGRDFVAKRVSTSVLFFESEKEAYLRAGLSLPKDYKISVEE